jgi:putative ABC transport system ATP-binding protein
MNIIGCLDVPTSGSYELDGRNLKDLSDDDLADIRNRHIGFVFQHFHLLPKMTALDNVALPLLYADVPLKERRERAAEALQAVGLGERMDFFPNQLSGGQCQRVAIARAMVTRPDLLLADEPTGALDTKSGNQIMEIFRQLSEGGMTIVMITHEPSIAECADKICYILDGELRTDRKTGEGASADEG